MNRSVPDPYVFGPPGSGSVIILSGSGSVIFVRTRLRNKKKKVKTLISAVKWLLNDFLSLKTAEVNVLTESSKQNKLEKINFLLASWKYNDKNNRIRIRKSSVWIQGSGSVQKCHEFGTLLHRYRSLLFRVAVFWCKMFFTFFFQKGELRTRWKYCWESLVLWNVNRNRNYRNHKFFPWQKRNAIRIRFPDLDPNPTIME